MQEIFRNYLKRKSLVSDEELDTILSFSTLKKLKKKEHLLREGEVWQYNAFMCKGCTRIYRISDDGSEHILRFASETWWVGDRESYTTDNPAKSNIDALEKSEILIWVKKDFEMLLKEIPALNTFSEQLIARSLNASQNRIYATISNTAEEKYHHFLEAYPDIFTRVPLHMIASYLGVTRETLSRIRHKDAGR